MSDTKFPHEDLLQDNSVVVTELPQKTQTLLTKFASETDSDKKDAMDEILYGQIDDFLEAKVAKAKAEATKAKVTAHKEKKKAGASKLDVSSASTAKTPEQEAADKAKQAADDKAKNPGLLKKYYGIGS